jgi:organic radical activating enzyme
MKEKTYKIVEMYETLQGEGFFAGHPIYLIRFKGCNVWNGNPDDRHKSKAMCGLWCDTDFVNVKKDKFGGTYTLTELEDHLLVSTDHYRTPIILLTGGEPLLQIDTELLVSLIDMGYQVNIETNGSQDFTQILDTLDLIMQDETTAFGKLWVTISPKPPLAIHESAYKLPFNIVELKCVLDKQHMDPNQYTDLNCLVRYVQPLDLQKTTNLKECIEFVLSSKGTFALSTQAHKVWNIE